ncbi:MAG: hypothetical protein AB7O44_26740 [Hyphomicrobiaceae bacterium]
MNVATERSKAVTFKGIGVPVKLSDRPGGVLGAQYRGHEVLTIYVDEGISGGKGRPGLDAALRDAVRRRYDVLAA